MSAAERWTDIEGWEGRYQISDHGRVRSLPRRDSQGRRRRGKVLKPFEHTARGGPVYTLSDLPARRCQFYSRAYLRRLDLEPSKPAENGRNPQTSDNIGRRPKISEGKP